MFIANKYSHWYNTLIQQAQTRTLPAETYTESHHIVPRSLGGANAKGNKVSLTAKEHFVCHLLLPKMTKHDEHTKKMNYACWRMANATGERYKTTSRIYEMARTAFIAGQLGHPNYLKKQSPESRKMISISMKQVLSTLTPAEKFNRIKNSCSSDESWTDDRCEKISKALKGVPKSKEHASKIADVVRARTPELKAKFAKCNLGKPWSENRRAAHNAKKGNTRA